jgi:hypothetical protein
MMYNCKMLTAQVIQTFLILTNTFFNFLLSVASFALLMTHVYYGANLTTEKVEDFRNDVFTIYIFYIYFLNIQVTIWHLPSVFIVTVPLQAQMCNLAKLNNSMNSH